MIATWQLKCTLLLSQYGTDIQKNDWTRMCLKGTNSVASLKAA